MILGVNEDIIADLKQFIAGVVAQEVGELRSDMASMEARLNTRIDELSASVAEALEAINEETDRRLKNHERRIARLERKAA